VSRDFELEPGVRPGADLPQNATLRRLSKSLNWINRQMLRLSMVALVLTSVVLTYSVLTRYLFKVPTDWQDEASVFMLVGAIFLCTAYVQAQRGHVGIEALAALLPAGVNRVRRIIVDCASTLFCGFFCWKSWTLFYEAWSEGQTTSSSFAPPLWIPYGLMAVGMTLLALQLLLQSTIELTGADSQEKPK
jgi:TRAP-type C4-dicarboxylate transport system permease small subunit